MCVSYLGIPLKGAAGPWQRRSAPGRWRRRGAVWGRTSCYRRSLLHLAQASGSVSPDAAAWRSRGPIQRTDGGGGGESVSEHLRKKRERGFNREIKETFLIQVWRKKLWNISAFESFQMSLHLSSGRQFLHGFLLPSCRKTPGDNQSIVIQVPKKSCCSYLEAAGNQNKE